jgi:hypothetical protein
VDLAQHGLDRVAFPDDPMDSQTDLGGVFGRELLLRDPVLFHEAFAVLGDQVLQVGGLAHQLGHHGQKTDIAFDGVRFGLRPAALGGEGPDHLVSFQDGHPHDGTRTLGGVARAVFAHAGGILVGDHHGLGDTGDPVHDGFGDPLVVVLRGEAHATGPHHEFGLPVGIQEDHEASRHVEVRFQVFHDGCQGGFDPGGRSQDLGDLEQSGNRLLVAMEAFLELRDPCRLGFSQSHSPTLLRIESQRVAGSRSVPS